MKNNNVHEAVTDDLRYAVTPAVLPIEDFLSGIEKAVRSLPEEAAEEVRQDTARIPKASRKPEDNLFGAERKALRALHTNADLKVLLANKGNAAVITSNCNRKAAALLGAPIYRRYPKDPTVAAQRKTTLLLKKSSLPEVILQLRPQSLRPPSLQVPENPTYRLALCLATLLAEYMANYPRHVKNSMEFTNIMKSLRASPDNIVSFDVVSLFITVPIGEDLWLLSRHSGDNLRLFRHVVTSSFFR
jgi:hypothetical protein